MRVGSLRKPREYDGRLPPDVDYYLDLVIPRFEEPPKKIGGRVRLFAWKNITNKVIDLHANLFQNIGKRTSNISENTSKSTSKANQIRLGMDNWCLTSPSLWVHGLWSNSRAIISRSGTISRSSPWETMGWLAQRPMAPAGEYTLERLWGVWWIYPPYSLGSPPQMAPQMLGDQ